MSRETGEVIVKPTCAPHVTTTRVQDWIRQHPGHECLLPWLSCMTLEPRELDTVCVRFSQPSHAPLFTPDLQGHLLGALRDMGLDARSLEIHAPKHEPFPSLQPNPRMTFETLSIGPANRLAAAAAKAVALEDGCKYNPFFLHGGIGQGKTHLLHAIIQEIARTQPRKIIRLLSSELFATQHTRAIDTRRIDAFRDWLLQADLIVIDDIHRLEAHPDAQGELFYLFDLLHARQKQMVFTADRAPRELNTLPDSLTSRFAWGLLVGIETPRAPTRRAIVLRKAQEMRLTLPEDVLDHLAENVHGNIRELEGLLNTLFSHAMLLNTEIDMTLVHSLTGRKQPRNVQTISITQIQEEVARFFNLDPHVLTSKSRTRSVAYPRQIGMYLTKQLTSASLEEIGAAFGGRDHSTVKHGCEKIRRLLEEDPRLRKQLDQIQDTLLRAAV